MFRWRWWWNNPVRTRADFAAALHHSRYFEPVEFSDTRAARQAMMAGRVSAILVLRQDFARQLRQDDGAAIQLIVNGVDANTARIISGYVQGAWGKWLEHAALQRGETLTVPVQMQQRVWFNSELRSRNFLVPGLIAVIMTLIGALLTAMVMSREWERGTMEALLVTPLSMREVILGKLLPYFMLGMGGLALAVGMALFLFEVPLRGSLWVLLATSALFLVTALGMGLLISTVARSQFVAGLIGPDHHLSAGVPAVRFHLRHRQHAGRGTAHHPRRRRALLRRHPADGVPGRKRVECDRAQYAGTAGACRGVPGPDLAQLAQAPGVRRCWPASTRW